MSGSIDYNNMVVFLLIPFLIFLIYKVLWKKNKKDLTNKHVVIIGGSSGIGKSLAVLAAKEKAHVTIIARNIEKLEEAIVDIKNNAASPATQNVNYVSVDVSNYDDIENNLCEIEETIGPIYMLVNCAGFAVCGELENFSISNIKELVKVNLLGSIYPLKAIIPKFKERNEGIILLCGSQASLLGIYGYAVYASCKFAVRGLAESVHMELKPYNVSVTLAVPPDTDTPGYHEESKTKPLETKRISDVAGLFNPDVVAAKILEDALAGNFFSYIGFESFMITTLCKGMTPFSSIFHVLTDTVLIGPFRLISAYYINQIQKIVQSCYNEKQIKIDNQKKKIH